MSENRTGTDANSMMAGAQQQTVAKAVGSLTYVGFFVLMVLTWATIDWAYYLPVYIYILPVAVTGIGVVLTTAFARPTDPTQPTRRALGIWVRYTLIGLGLVGLAVVGILYLPQVREFGQTTFLGIPLIRLTVFAVLILMALLVTRAVGAVAFALKPSLYLFVSFTLLVTPLLSLVRYAERYYLIDLPLPTDSGGVGNVLPSD